VVVEAHGFYRDIERTAKQIKKWALEHLAAVANPGPKETTLYNSLSFPRTELMERKDGSLTTVTVPGLGYMKVDLKRPSTAAAGICFSNPPSYLLLFEFASFSNPFASLRMFSLTLITLTE
jgi:hypothetical protein